MVELFTLGTVDLRRDSDVISTVLSQPKRIALLAYVASAQPRGFHSRDRLLALFWPEADAEKARNSLRQALHQLRRSLGDDAIMGRGDREIAVDPTLVHCDAADFDDAIAAKRWEDALALYRGDFLAGLYVQDAPDAERWVDDERLRRRRDAVSAAWHLADTALAAHELTAAGDWARRAVSLEPSDEAGVRRLVDLLERAGDPAGALSAYESFAERLEKDFEIRPSPETRKLVAALRARSRAATGEWSAVGRAEGARSRPERTEARAPVATRRIARLAGATILVLLAVSYGVHSRAPQVDVSPSIAVLPFVNMTGDSTKDYFSDGMTEELLNLLAAHPELRVAARTSSFAFKGRGVSADSIGRVLRVRHLVEGSVRQSGDRIRITAQLIDASTGYHVWSQTFDAELRDVFAVQDSISRRIVETLRVQLASGRAVRHAPSDPEAHVAVLKGWRVFRQNTREAWLIAAADFQSAIQRDSLYGAAWAGLAYVRMWQSEFRQIPLDSGYSDASRFALRALALDSTLIEPHITLGRIAETRATDATSALAHYERAIALNPGDPRGYGRKSAVLVRLGRKDEGLAAAKRAAELDPASPAVYSDLAKVYNDLNRTFAAESALRSALALDPGHPILLGQLGINLSYQKRYAEALALVAEARRKAPREGLMIGQHAYVLAKLGRRAEAMALLDTAAAVGSDRIGLATTYAVLGEKERAIGLVEAAVRDHDPGVVAILDPDILAEIRGDARMKRLVAEVKRR